MKNTVVPLFVFMMAIQPLFAANDQQIERAYQLINKRGYREAVTILKAVVKAEPRNIQARRYMAFALNRLGMANEAVEQMKVVTGLSPGSAEDLATLAESYALSGENQKAAATYKAALAANPALEKCRSGLVKAYIASGDSAAARNACVEGIRNSRDPKVRKQLNGFLNQLQEKPETQRDSRG